MADSENVKSGSVSDEQKNAARRDRAGSRREEGESGRPNPRASYSGLDETSEDETSRRRGRAQELRDLNRTRARRR